MTNRSLPKIKALLPDGGYVPDEAQARFTSVRAVNGDERSLNIFGRIGEDPFSESGGVTDRMVAAVLRRMGAGPVTVNINSQGGDYITGVNIFHQLAEHDGEITARILGIAASAASVITMASDRILIGKAASIMIHNARGVTIGEKSDHAKSIEMLTQFDASMNRVYSDRTGNTAKQIEKWMDAQTFFSGEDAVKHGFADELLASDQIKDDAEANASVDVVALRTRARAILQESGKFTRAERRALLVGDDGGMSRAASSATSRAGDIAALLNIPSLFKRS
jgi:ATP-dependent protease ClpP protease subunit